MKYVKQKKNNDLWRGMIGTEKSTDYMKFYMAKIVSNNFGLLWKEMLSLSGSQSSKKSKNIL